MADQQAQQDQAAQQQAAQQAQAAQQQAAQQGQQGQQAAQQGQQAVDPQKVQAKVDQLYTLARQAPAHGAQQAGLAPGHMGFALPHLGPIPDNVRQDILNLGRDTLAWIVSATLSGGA